MSVATIESLPLADISAGPVRVHDYGVYGVHVRSEIPLPLLEHTGRALCSINLRSESEGFFANAVRGHVLRDRTEWHRAASLADGSNYVQWRDLGEFLISADGRCIACRKFPEAAAESFHVYLLCQALGYALIRQGIEPLHATALMVEGKMIALLGYCGFGKSTLAAYLLHTGATLVTDDMLILEPRQGGYVGYPGPARIKLLPAVARRFLGKGISGVPMNSDTHKLVIPADAPAGGALPAPLARLYALCAPSEVRSDNRIRFEYLSSREACISVVGNTFSAAIASPERLQRQADAAIRLVRSVPVKKLFYPRVLGRLPAVREAIVQDLASPSAPNPARAGRPA